MGEAKRRGTYEQRRAEAIRRNHEQAQLRRYVDTRKPSPKHLAFLATLAGLGIGLTGKRGNGDE